MEELYIAILKRIENEMPEIAYIDEDYGQLEGMNSENEDFYPVTFPCGLERHRAGNAGGRNNIDRPTGHRLLPRYPHRKRNDRAYQGTYGNGRETIPDTAKLPVLPEHGRTGQSQKPGLYPARKHQGV